MAELITELEDTAIETEWSTPRGPLLQDDDATDPGGGDDDATDPGGDDDATDPGGGDDDATDA